MTRCYGDVEDADVIVGHDAQGCRNVATRDAACVRVDIVACQQIRRSPGCEELYWRAEPFCHNGQVAVYLVGA